MSTKLKRILATTLLAITLVTSVFTGCDSETLPNQTVTQVQQKLTYGAIQDDESVIKDNSLPMTNETPKFDAVYDLSSKYPTPGSQGSLGCCVAWAVTYYKAYQENIEFNNEYTNSNKFSPSYVYNQINGGVDNGSKISDAMELIKTKGVCTLDVMPYTENDYKTIPNEAQHSQAAKYKSKTWATVFGTNGIKSGIKETGGVVVSIDVYPDFDNINAKNDIFDVKSGTLNGRHAVCLVGWDDSKQAFKFINSWGTDWGINGFGYVSYDFVDYGYIMTDITEEKLVIKNSKLFNLDGTCMYEGDYYVIGGYLAFLNGKGKMTYVNGDIYEGDWVDNKRNGKGKYTYFDNDSVKEYEGDWADDERTGKGKETLFNGDIYEGDFVDGERNGKGKYTSAENGYVIEGDFKNGEPNGKVKETFKSGNVYEGDFVNGKRNGNGKMTYADGSVYEGEWLDSNKHGNGTLKDENGDIIHSGRWENDEFIG